MAWECGDAASEAVKVEALDWLLELVRVATTGEDPSKEGDEQAA